MRSVFEEMGSTYTLASYGMYYPNLVSEDERVRYGRYGRLRLAYLKESCKGLYNALWMQGKLISHLNEIDDAARQCGDLLICQMKGWQGIDEVLKEHDHMAWVGAMNNTRNAAEKIVLDELIYS